MTNQYPVTGSVLDTSLDGTEQVEIVNGANALKTTTQAIANLSVVTAGITQLTGDVTAGPGSGSEAATLATVNANVGSFTLADVTVNAKGLVTAASSGGAAPLVLTGQTSTPGALTGTLTNAPATGNPQFWLQVSINGTLYYIPAWHV